MKRIVLSRKGFDSVAGGVASPIFADEKIFSIPIPQKSPSPHKYSNLKFNGLSGKEILKEASVKNVTISDYCHYDPLLTEKIGIFGQASASQTELKKNNVNVGDIFLFFGWFKQYSKKGKDLHHLFGWLQIDKIIENQKEIIEYLKNIDTKHPHGYGDISRFTNNTIYIAKKKMVIPNKKLSLKGFGLFKNTHSELILTEQRSSRSRWKLPDKYFSDTKNLFLNRLKWKDEKNCLVDCIGQGQEYILNAEENPKIIDWVIELIRDHG